MATETVQVAVYSEKTYNQRSAFREAFRDFWSKGQDLVPAIEAECNKLGLRVKFKPNQYPFALSNTVRDAFKSIHGHLFHSRYSDIVTMNEDEWRGEPVPSDDEFKAAQAAYEAAMKELVIVYAQSTRHAIHMTSQYDDALITLSGKEFFPTPEMKELADTVVKSAAEMFKVYAIFGYARTDRWNALLDAKKGIEDRKVGYV